MVDLAQQIHKSPLLGKDARDQVRIALVTLLLLGDRRERWAEASDPSQSHHAMNAGHRSMQVPRCVVEACTAPAADLGQIHEPAAPAAPRTLAVREDAARTRSAEREFH
jgi:hypothetical protein